ncbi:MAG: hypothetical protein ACLGIJ_05075 [Candidatus Limnocylindria bacterium]
MPVRHLPAHTGEGACCGACAGAEAAALAAGTASPPVLAGEEAIGSTRPVVVTPRRIDRDADRRITFSGLLVAGAFVVAAIVAGAAAASGGGSSWLALHLALAGAAGTAIATVLPVFVAALAVAAPARPLARIAAIGLVAGGAAMVSWTVAAGDAFLGHVGGSIYIAGIVAVALVAFRPLRGAMGPRRRRVEIAYGAALLQVGVSATIATAFLSGWMPVVERWAWLKPAHAWLNVVGFLSLVIVATLIHLVPTVEGTRIRPRRTASVAIAGLVIGVPLIALGYALAIDLVARAGAVMVLVGALVVPVHARAVAREQGRWTTDPGWHRFTTWSLRAAGGWFAAAMLVGTGRVVWLGADPAGWSINLVAAPLAVGWVLQVLIGSWSHLLPAIGPGDPAAHARQRAVLGTAATPRLVALNGGVAALWAGWATGNPVLMTIGGVAVAGSLGAAVAIAARAADVAIRRPYTADDGPTIGF